MTKWYKAAAVVGVFALAVAFLYPNIFGNQPDAIADESYFLTSSLSALQKHTLPGWEFSESGAYYGGVQTYIDTVVLVPVLAGAMLAQHSITQVQAWVALNTGNLLHLLRLVNAFLFVASLVAAALYLWYRKVPSELGLMCGLLLALLLGNSLIVMTAHTAKVWVLYIIIEMLAGSLVVAQEFYKDKGEEFISRRYYIGWLLWLAALSCFQTIVGVFSTGLWLVWALWLRHIAFIDIWHYIKKWWWLFVLAALTQVSFFYRAFFMRERGGLLDPQGTSGGAIDWAHRILAPLHDVFLSQPFILFVPVLALLVWHKRTRQYAVALLHPLLIYVFFYLLLGFDVAVRYSLILGVACSFSLVMLVPRGWQLRALLSSASILACAVLVHALMLYWTPSLQLRLVTAIQYGTSATDVFVVDKTASTLQLPLNTESLKQLGEVDAAKSRYAFLREHLSLVPSDFAPLVFYTHSDQERGAAVARERAADKRVFLVSLPKDTESAAEPHTLPLFFATQQLGTSYVVEKVEP